MSEKGAEFLNQLKLSHPTLSEQLDVLTDLYTRKLWHQLTDELEKFVVGTQFNQPGSLGVFYDQFVKEFAFRLNKLRLAQIARRVSENFGDLSEARAFSETTLNVVKGNKEAELFTKTRLASICLASGQIKEAKEILIAVREAIDEMADADPIVHSALARAAMEYHKSQGTATEYYKNALLFLAYTPGSKLTPEETNTIAIELGIAACVGDDVYNFGELLAHSTIQSLETTMPWLYELLVAFNTGSIPKYLEATSTNAVLLQNQPALVGSKHIMDEKIRILSLLEVIFHLPAAERTLTFQQVADATQQPLDKVEHILMRSMSLGLLRGIIDEVDQTVHVSWIKPRVLPKQQLEVLKTRLGQWAANTDTTLQFLEGNASELVA